ncbi:MAG: hypothetical protein LBT22_02025 [Peptococcaceae bacterium]|jgi:hypothetical protein|nr:hypothetical protein [Peptococcaceae bacterium]
MNVTEESANFMIDLLTAKIAELLAAANDEPITDAMREFMSTKTFELLSRPQSYLYLESPEYILDMLAAERSQDIERWLEV